MTDRPVIFSAAMVRALLAGRKTQTRRLAWRMDCGNRVQWSPTPWQRAEPGDRLYVRENWKPYSIYAGMKPRDIPKSRVFYAADDAYAPSNTPWVPSIHMPRWASRFTMTVTAARLERLQGISEEDAIAEGCEPLVERTRLAGFPVPIRDARGSYRRLWNDLHGADAWDANPEVVALTFTVAVRNIDA